MPSWPYSLFWKGQISLQSAHWLHWCCKQLHAAAHLQVVGRRALHAPVADVHHAPAPRRDLEVRERLHDRKMAT